MPQLKAQLTGIPQTLRKNNQLAIALQRVGRKMFGEIGQYMVMSAKRNFSEHVSPDNAPWQPLSKRTVAQKGHTRILFLTGALNRAIQVISLDTDRVSVGVTGTETSKAMTHQFGREKVHDAILWVPAYTRVVKGQRIRVKAHTRRGSLPPIPARPFLGFSEHRDDINNIGKIASRHLQVEARRIANGA